ncbi:cysteine-rich venom protein pseudechetoxin-like [Neocloeon triangulifer]|uniref:cysteine-rich venom protein pseudechetoxin-like n=1 Tax=Neocloeon triangulifer TaxID=2078957 RepID=UPI00286EC620|nr:cysteine-rich venom protein pseudechetoxin-like [Neocloeon triangulifer]
MQIATIFLFMFISPILGLTDEERSEIVNNHNNYRANVQPAAADMLSMSWHPDAEKSAQLWASQCKKLVHDNSENMNDGKYGHCGQNIFVSSGQLPWSTAVKAWYSEVSKFKYGSSRNNFAEIGHYTQVVWAQSHKVGCGYAQCRDSTGYFHNYVCNYCPAGNVVGKINTPYKAGAKCSACPNSCLSNGLCAQK